jgi:hypothetical protein
MKRRRPQSCLAWSDTREHATGWYRSSEREWLWRKHAGRGPWPVIGKKKNRIGTELALRTRISVLVLGSAATVNRTTILVYVAIAVPKAKEAEDALAERRGLAVGGVARISRACLGAI